MATSGSALVIKSTGSWYTLCDTTSGETFQGRLKGKMRLGKSRSTNPIVVGDIIDYDADDNMEAVIKSIHERRNYIIRRSSNLSRESHIIAANIDQAFLVATLDFPVTNYEFIDRFLVTSEAYKIPVTIILNKTDLYDTAELSAQKEEFLRIYAAAGYRVMETSARDELGVEAIRKLLAGKISLFSGNSGVGKSTLITAIDPTLNLRTGEVSGSSRRGKHTTTFSEMFPLFTATLSTSAITNETVEATTATTSAAASATATLQSSSTDGNTNDYDTSTNRTVSPSAPNCNSTSNTHSGQPLASGYLIDTPGIKGFGLIDIANNEICRYFPDLFRHAPQCQYYNCIHTHEPGCAVKAAFERGEVGETRYISYLKLLDDDDKYRK